MFPKHGDDMRQFSHPLVNKHSDSGRKGGGGGWFGRYKGKVGASVNVNRSLGKYNIHGIPNY
jgi:hypothetical protein